MDCPSCRETKHACHEVVRVIPKLKLHALMRLENEFWPIGENKWARATKLSHATGYLALGFQQVPLVYIIIASYI